MQMVIAVRIRRYIGAGKLFIHMINRRLHLSQFTFVLFFCALAYPKALFPADYF